MSGGSQATASEFSVLVSLGSNVRPEENLVAAVHQLAAVLPVYAASAVFRTRPVAERSMPDFLNAAVEIRTATSPGELKYGLFRELEWRLGRRRTEDRNAPRPVDLDIALHGDGVLDSEALGLTIPDPEILTRAHVALPLADLAPERRHPVTGETLSAIAARLLEAQPAGAIRRSERADLLRDLVAS